MHSREQDPHLPPSPHKDMLQDGCKPVEGCDQDLQLEVRRKGYKRRVLQRTSWHLARGMELAVNLYALSRTATKPSPKCALLESFLSLSCMPAGPWCSLLQSRSQLQGSGHGCCSFATPDLGDSGDRP